MKILTEWAVTSSILILIVTALRALLKERLSARARYALWAVVLVRLLVPVQLSCLRLPVSAAAAAPQAPPAVQEPIPLFPLEQIPLEEAPLEEIPDPAGFSRTPGAVAFNAAGRPWQAAPEGQEAVRYWAAPTAAQLLAGLWLLGAAALGGALLAGGLRFGRGLRRRRQALEADSPIPVYEDGTLETSFLFGLRRPGVYLSGPAARDGEVRRHVLAHELTHYAHGDHLWAALRCACLALHWYNPLVWMAAFLSRRDGELACDEGAVARLGEAERLRYGRTLVDLSAGRGGPLWCAIAMEGGKKTLQQRIALLVKRPRTRLAAGIAAAAAVTAGALFTFAARGGPETGLRAEFLEQLEGASLVYIHRPTVFSYAFPPVTSPDLTARARAVLEQIQPLEQGEAPPRAAPEALDSASVSFTEDNRTLYVLNLQDGKCFVQLRREDGDFEPAGTLPEDAAARLLELAGIQAERSAFEHCLERAEAVLLGPPPASGVSSAPVIEGEEELAEARALLTGWQRWDGIPLPAGEEGWDALWADSVRITLWDGAEWRQYCLSQGEEYRFLFVRWSLDNPDEVHGYTLVGVLPGETAQALGALASQQSGGDGAFRTALEGMTSLKFLGGALSSYIGPEIVDRDLVEKARELLSSADLDSGTAGPAQLYFDASVTLFGPGGEALYTQQITDRAAASALEGLAREQGRRQTDPTPLTPAELKEFEALLLGDEHFNLLFQFLHNQYSDARDVDLYELFYVGTEPGTGAESSITPEELRLLTGGEDPMVGCTKITPAQMDAVLKRYTGLTLAETNQVHLDRFTYLPQYDAYYHFHGDTNYSSISEFTYGTRSGNMVWLWYQNTTAYPAEGVWVLSLEQTGEDWLIRANENLVVYNARMSGDKYPGYEMLGAAAFAAALRVQDVVSVTLEQDGARVSGSARPDLEALKRQLTDAMGLQFEGDYDPGRHGRYQVTIQVRDGDGRENGAPEYRLLLSAGDREDVVYLEHPDWNGHVFHTFALCPELYRTILDLF